MPRPDAATAPLPPAEEFRWVAADFSSLVRGVAPERWDAPAPVPGWVARDVVRHLVEWFPPFLDRAAGVALPAGPSVDDDPVAAWQVFVDGVQGVLDDPATAGRTLADPHVGELPVASAIDQFLTSDVFLHAWDLARATDQPNRLDPAKCEEMLTGMLPMDEMLRASGEYGPKVQVPADADVETQLMGFIGRDPR